MYINKNTMQEAEIRTPVCPSRITTDVGELNNPDATQQETWYQTQGWLRIVSREVVPDGYRVTGWTVTDLWDGTALLTIASSVNIAEEQAAAEAAAQAAYQADLQANAYRYALENAYILLCDTLRGDTSHARIDGPEFATRIAGLRQKDVAAYERLRDSYNFVKSQLDPIDIQWALRAQYRDVPEIVARAQQMIGLLA